MRAAHDAPAALPDGLGDLHETQQDKDEMRSRKFGRNLYGNSHVSGIRVAAPEGGVGLWFLFTVSRAPLAGAVADVRVGRHCKARGHVSRHPRIHCHQD